MSKSTAGNAASFLLATCIFHDWMLTLKKNVSKEKLSKLKNAC